MEQHFIDCTTMGHNETREAAEVTRLLFIRNVEFVRGVQTLDQLPDFELPEVAFAGRSNVGKSSLINALTDRTSLARTSQTPGCTKQLNFFSLDNKMYLVDMPGYGYAKASKSDVKLWQSVMRNYLIGRPTLRRVYVLIDGRLGMKKSDEEMMDMLDTCAVSYMVVATKLDYVKDPDKLKSEIENQIKKRPAAYPEIILTSSCKKTGIMELREEIAKWVLDQQA